MVIITYKIKSGESVDSPNDAYRQCAQYAASQSMLITHVYPYTEDNHEEVLLHIAYLMAAAQGMPNDLIAYEADDIRTPENKDLLLPLVTANFINLHLVHFSLRFKYSSPPDHLERGAFKKLEEQAFWAEQFQLVNEILI